MTNAIETFKFSANGINFTANVVSYDCNDTFNDEWKMTDDHEGGVTVQNPNACRNSYKYGIPLNYSLAERVRDLTAKGDSNPSANAYRAAQEALERDLSANDYGIQVSAEIDGIELYQAENMVCGFNYSYDDPTTLLEEAQAVFKDYDGEEEALKKAKEEAARILEKFDVLKNIVA